MTKSKGDVFIAHIQEHLKEDQAVVCKICWKTVDGIYNEYLKNHATSGKE